MPNRPFFDPWALFLNGTHVSDEGTQNPVELPQGCLPPEALLALPYRCQGGQSERNCDSNVPKAADCVFGLLGPSTSLFCRTRSLGFPDLGRNRVPDPIAEAHRASAIGSGTRFFFLYTARVQALYKERVQPNAWARSVMVERPPQTRGHPGSIPAVVFFFYEPHEKVRARATGRQDKIK